jgi:hypothetical protein
MARFLIYRNGSNAANQPGCARMAVAIVTASDAQEARFLAEENVLFYINQTSEAVTEEEADADDWNEVSQLAVVSNEFYVG